MPPTTDVSDCLRLLGLPFNTEHSQGPGGQLLLHLRRRGRVIPHSVVEHLCLSEGLDYNAAVASLDHPERGRLRQYLGLVPPARQRSGLRALQYLTAAMDAIDREPGLLEPFFHALAEIDYLREQPVGLGHRDRHYGVRQNEPTLVFGYYWQRRIAGLGLLSEAGFRYQPIDDAPGVFPPVPPCAPRIVLTHDLMDAVTFNRRFTNISAVPAGAAHCPSPRPMPDIRQVLLLHHTQRPLNLAHALRWRKQCPQLMIVELALPLSAAPSDRLFHALNTPIGFWTFVAHRLIEDTSSVQVLMTAALDGDDHQQLAAALRAAKAPTDLLDLVAGMATAVSDRTLGEATLRKEANGYRLICPTSARLSNFTFLVDHYRTSADGRQTTVHAKIQMAGGTCTNLIAFPISMLNTSSGSFCGDLWQRVCALDRNYNFMFQAAELKGFTWLDVLRLFDEKPFYRELSRLGYDKATDRLLLPRCSIDLATGTPSVAAYTVKDSGAQAYNGIGAGLDFDPRQVTDFVRRNDPAGLGIMAALLHVIYLCLLDRDGIVPDHSHSLLYLSNGNGWRQVVRDAYRVCSGSSSLPCFSGAPRGYDSLGALPLFCELPQLTGELDRPVVAVTSIAAAGRWLRSGSVQTAELDSRVFSESPTALSAAMITQLQGWLAQTLGYFCANHDSAEFETAPLQQLYQIVCARHNSTSSELFSTLFSTAKEAEMVDAFEIFCDRLSDLLNKRGVNVAIATSATAIPRYPESVGHNSTSGVMINIPATLIAVNQDSRRQLCLKEIVAAAGDHGIAIIKNRRGQTYARFDDDQWRHYVTRGLPSLLALSA